MSVALYRRFPLQRPDENHARFYAAFWSAHVIVHAAAREVRYDEHASPLSVKCVFGCRDMVLDYFDNGTLADFIAARGPSSPDVVVSIGCQLASALRLLHRNGIIHRDIKPENVMLVQRRDDLYCPKLIDLSVADVDRRGWVVGLSLLLSRGRAPGTRGYMSPAQLCGQPVEATDDLFSFAMTLYELATGRLPWQRDGETRTDYLSLTAAALYKRQTETRVVDPRCHVPTMRRGFAEALVWPLAVSPSERPEDVREYTLALARETPPANELALDGLQIVDWRANDLLRDDDGAGEQVEARHGTRAALPIRRRWRGALRRLPPAARARRDRAITIGACVAGGLVEALVGLVAFG